MSTIKLSFIRSHHRTREDGIYTERASYFPSRSDAIRGSLGMLLVNRDIDRVEAGDIEVTRDNLMDVLNGNPDVSLHGEENIWGDISRDEKGKWLPGDIREELPPRGMY